MPRNQWRAPIDTATAQTALESGASYKAYTGKISATDADDITQDAWVRLLERGCKITRSTVRSELNSAIRRHYVTRERERQAIGTHGTLRRSGVLIPGILVDTPGRKNPELVCNRTTEEQSILRRVRTAPHIEINRSESANV